MTCIPIHCFSKCCGKKQNKPRDQLLSLCGDSKNREMAFWAALAKANGATATENKGEDSCQDFSDIWALKRKADELRIQLEKQRLTQQLPLKTDEVFASLAALEKQLESVVQGKEASLAILRNPEEAEKSENSISLKRDRQSDLIESVDTLVGVIEQKQTHLANSSWIINQNWQSYGQELDKINRKLLQLEALIAKNAHNIEEIQNSV